MVNWLTKRSNVRGTRALCSARALQWVVGADAGLKGAKCGSVGVPGPATTSTCLQSQPGPYCPMCMSKGKGQGCCPRLSLGFSTLTLRFL